LRQLPSPSESQTQSLASLSLPPAFRSERKLFSTSNNLGVDVLKVVRNGKLQQRRVAFSSDNRTIYVTTNRIRSVKHLLKTLNPAQKNPVSAKGIDVSTIHSIQRGQQTNRFFMARSIDTLPQHARDDLPGDDSRCLSIIYRVSTAQASSYTDNISGTKPKVVPHRFDTLDLVVPKAADYQSLVTALEQIVERYRQDIKTYSSELLFLEYHWIDLEKEISQEINQGEFTTMCDRMNVPMKKPILQTYFQDFCRELGAEDETINIRQTYSLLEVIKEVCIDDVGIGELEHPLHKIWSKILETDPVPSPTFAGADPQAQIELELNPVEPSISAVAFLSFLRSQQREYSVSLDNVHALAGVLNSQVTFEDIWPAVDRKTNPIEKERINKSRFLSFMTSDWNDIMDPKLGTPGACDMTQPLSHYWINSSHDTYLGQLPNSFKPRTPRESTHSAVDIQMYVAALNRGVRCLEVDCWDGLYGEPVVARLRPTDNTCTIPFLDILRLLRSFLKENPDSFPIILYMENHCSVSKQETMARDLEDVLGAENMLYIPPETMKEKSSLPSPDALRGKIVVKSKRPKIIKEGATILDDDFDDENTIMEDDEDIVLDSILDDDDIEEDAKGWIVGFEAAGPIRSKSPKNAKRHVTELLEEAVREATNAKVDFERAELKAKELSIDAADTERMASRLASECGLSLGQIKALALEEKAALNTGCDADDEGTEVNLNDFTTSDTGENEPLNQGIEVHDFFGEAVEGARATHSTADTEALKASLAVNVAKHNLDKAEETLRIAKVGLENSYKAEKDATEASRKASAIARANREHADTARSRVDTVKDLLKKVKDGASSAETIAVTAETEAKISEQRAAMTEARASRALATADKERAKADLETKREERLEQEAAQYHEICVEATKLARTCRDRMEKAAGMLDRCNEQIKLIERSSQYQQELRESNTNSRADSDVDGVPRYSSRFLDKHASKLDERKMCLQLIKESSTENSAAEAKRRRAQSAFEDAAHTWKGQAEVAAAARKQADRSSQIAEELAEHAEEEREAATLRHIAREKAQKSISQTDNNRTSAQAQLAEAERASAEAASLATESRQNAERLAREAASAKDHTHALRAIDDAVLARDAAQSAFNSALNNKLAAESKAANAKRIYDTSAEVFSSAKREAAAEAHNLTARRQWEKNAVLAYSKALILRKEAQHAHELAKIAATTSFKKAAAERHARDFKDKMDKTTMICPDLASMTALHSCKFRYWEKSHSLPFFYMHSISQSLVLEKLETDERKTREDFAKFTKTHLCRTFPSWKVTEKSSNLNFDPVVQHSLGCQIVAMNFHSADEPLLVNDGRFRANGSSGYVLKPPHLINDKSPIDREQQWKISVLCGSCLPRAESYMSKKNISVSSSSILLNPFVRVTLFEGNPNSGPVLVHSTAPAKGNGLNPVWDSEKDTFDMFVVKPSIAIVLFSVYDANTKDFIAGAALPLSCCREGYRSIALFDSMHMRCGPYAFASLFVKVQKLS